MLLDGEIPVDDENACHTCRCGSSCLAGAGSPRVERVHDRGPERRDSKLQRADQRVTIVFGDYDGNYAQHTGQREEYTDDRP